MCTKAAKPVCSGIYIVKNDMSLEIEQSDTVTAKSSLSGNLTSLVYSYNIHVYEFERYVRSNSPPPPPPPPPPGYGPGEVYTIVRTVHLMSDDLCIVMV